jgi:ATP-dependent Lon protease
LRSAVEECAVLEVSGGVGGHERALRDHSFPVAYLLDRMEVISLPGYTEQEKLQKIARRQLMRRQLHPTGPTQAQSGVDDEALRLISNSTLVTALASLVTGRNVRSDTAMMAGISLRGLVLPVGGIKETVVTAAAAGLTRVRLPALYRRDAGL